MANFAVAADPEAILKANQVMEMYEQKGDRKQDTLLRIMAVAEANSVKGTHPELAESLGMIEGTINTLIEQINGIAAGQDNHIRTLNEKLEKAMTDSDTALESVRKERAEMQEHLAQADSEVQAARKQMKESEEKSAVEIAALVKERDQALRERDDARTISQEKTSLNSLYKNQIRTYEEALQDYRQLQENYKTVQNEYRDLQARLSSAELTIAANETEYRHSLEAARSQAEADLKKALADGALEKERAVIETERRLRDSIEKERLENMRLQTELMSAQDNLKATFEENHKLRTTIQNMETSSASSEQNQASVI